MPTTRVSALACLAVLVTIAATGCGGSFGRLTSAERIPADGSLGGPGPSALKVQAVSSAEWGALPKKKLAPACDARGGAPKADKAALDKTNASIAAWTEYLKKNPKPVPKPVKGPTVGDVVGIERTDGSRTLTSLSITCAADKPATIEMSGTSYAFDLAWVFESKAKRLGVQALSLKDKKLYYAMIFTPPSPKDRIDEIAIIANVSSYFPADADEPLVIGGTDIDSRFETFVFGKGKTQGFYWLVPLSPNLSVERYLGVGAFAVGG